MRPHHPAPGNIIIFTDVKFIMVQTLKSLKMIYPPPCRWKAGWSFVVHKILIEQLVQRDPRIQKPLDHKLIWKDIITSEEDARARPQRLLKLNLGSFFCFLTFLKQLLLGCSFLNLNFWANSSFKYLFSLFSKHFQSFLTCTCFSSPKALCFFMLTMTVAWHRDLLQTGKVRLTSAALLIRDDNNSQHTC